MTYLDIDLDDTRHFIFPECANDRHPDDHWFLNPICQTCGRPDGDYPHNEFGERDRKKGIDDGRWHEFVMASELVFGETAFRGNACRGWHDNSWKPEPEDRRSEQCSCRCHWGTYYVNVYRLDQNYGGPEEGDWYYESGEVVGTMPMNTLREAETLAATMRVSYPEGRNRYSVMPRAQDYAVVIEREIATDWPTERPRYS